MTIKKTLGILGTILLLATPALEITHVHADSSNGLATSFRDLARHGAVTKNEGNDQGQYLKRGNQVFNINPSGPTYDGHHVSNAKFQALLNNTNSEPTTHTSSTGINQGTSDSANNQTQSSPAELTQTNELDKNLNAPHMQIGIIASVLAIVSVIFAFASKFIKKIKY